MYSLKRYWSSHRKRERSVTIKNQSTTIYDKTIYIIQEMINVNKFNLRDIMKLNSNRK